MRVLHDVLTVKEAAELLRVSEETVRRRADDGTLPGLFLGVWRFSRAGLMEAMRPDWSPTGQGIRRNKRPSVAKRGQSGG